MRVSLLSNFSELNTQINRSNNLVSKIRGLRLPYFEVKIITELAFLRIFIAWECFLEDSFIKYLVGAPSLSGRNNPKSFVNPPNIEKAREILLGERKRGYIGWNSANTVIHRANIYFKGGEPYSSALTPFITEIDDINTIRNRIAHKSKKATQKFNEFIRREFGYGTRGMTPGRLLLTTNTFASRITITYFDYYLRIIRTASQKIVQ